MNIKSPKKHLLVFLSAVFVCVQTQAVSVENLFVEPESKYFFTDTDNSFLLQIPGVLPSKVQVSVDRLPGEARFISSYKNAVLIEGEQSTAVRLWFSFSEPGKKQLAPLTVRINGRRYFVPFKEFTVYRNPELLEPELLVEFRNKYGRVLKPSEDGFIFVEAEEPIKIYVSVLYVSQVLHLDWKLPEGVIFSELERFSVTEKTGKAMAFSEEPLALAVFEWISLKEGNFKIPEIQVEVEAYNHRHYELHLPKLELAAKKTKTETAETSSIPEALKPAFLEQSDLLQENKTDKSDFNLSAAKTLAQLRKNERMSFPFSSAKKERESFERQHGIMEGEAENSAIVIFGIAAFAFLSLLVAIILLVLRYKKTACVFFLVFVILSVTAFLLALPLMQDTAVFVGGIVRTIPEEKAGTAVPIPPLSVVQVLERTGAWCYIYLNGTGGWVFADSVINISK